MKPAAFVIIMLLSAALTTAMSMTHARGAPAMNDDAPKIHDEFLTPDEEDSRDQNKFTEGEAAAGGAEAGGTNLGASEHYKKPCVSVEYCKKKSEFCAKICAEKHAGGVDHADLHVPDLKCFLKCKKCIPTCM